MKLSKHHVEILKTAESWINEIGYKVKTRDNGNVRSWIFDEGENTDGTKPFSITVIVDSEKDSHIVDVEMEDGSQVTKQINDKVKNDMFALGPDSPNSTSSDDDEQVDDDDNDETVRKTSFFNVENQIVLKLTYTANAGVVTTTSD
jgi:regulator of RNase E activity RraB